MHKISHFKVHLECIFIFESEHSYMNNESNKIAHSFYWPGYAV